MKGPGPGNKVRDCEECPFEHPRVCSKLLNHGDGKNSKYGCDGSSCKKAHPTMCTSSMWTRKCWKLCNRGWHIKGTKFEEGEVPVQEVQKRLQRKPNYASSHEFPPLSPVQHVRNGNQIQQLPLEAYQEQTQRIFSVPPPTIPFKNKDFKCMDCPAEFESKTKFKNHYELEHSNIESQKEASFLEAVQRSLLKLLPKALETCMNGLVQNQNQSPQTGSSNVQMRWVQVPANLN